MSEADAGSDPHLHQQAKTLVATVGDPLTESGIRALKDSVFNALKVRDVSSVVLDFSAVDTVDTSTLNECDQLVDGVRVLGAVAAVAALRPHVAETAAELGNFFSKIDVYRSVHVAIETFRTTTR